jgi:hypothetical protein
MDELLVKIAKLIIDHYESRSPRVDQGMTDMTIDIPASPDPIKTSGDTNIESLLDDMENELSIDPQDPQDPKNMNED